MVKWWVSSHLRPTLLSTKLFWNCLSFKTFSSRVECFISFVIYENCLNLKISSIRTELHIFLVYTRSLYLLGRRQSYCSLTLSTPDQMNVFSYMPISPAYSGGNHMWYLEDYHRIALWLPRPILEDPNSEEITALINWIFLLEQALC